MVALLIEASPGQLETENLKLLRLFVFADQHDIRHDLAAHQAELFLIRSHREREDRVAGESSNLRRRSATQQLPDRLTRSWKMRLLPSGDQRAFGRISGKRRSDAAASISHGSAGSIMRLT